jgi:hypothetical protein
MARSYKRDKNGQFASTGSTGSIGRSVEKSRSRQTRMGLSTSAGKTKASRTNEIMGTKRKGNKTSAVTVKQSMGNAGGRFNGAKDVIRTERTGSYLYGANKAIGNKVRRVDGPDAGSSRYASSSESNSQTSAVRNKQRVAQTRRSRFGAASNASERSMNTTGRKADNKTITQASKPKSSTKQLSGARAFRDARGGVSKASGGFSSTQAKRTLGVTYTTRKGNKRKLGG